MSDKTILIVDDAPENISVLGSLLSDYNIKVATNGEKALKIVNSGAKIDLILLDVVMPVMNGFEVAEKLKSDAKTAFIPIIFVTGQTDSQSFIKGFELGAEEYIMKPYDAEAVLRIVKQKII